MDRKTIRRGLAATAATALSAGLLASVPAQAESRVAKPEVNTSRLTKAVTVNGVLKHLRQLQTIANRNGGNRASGLPGYDASADYVAKTLREAGYTVTEQTFTFPFFQENTPATLSQLTPEARDVETAVMTYSGSGDVSGPVVPTTNLVIPATPEPSSTSGCAVSDFPAPPAEDAIALAQRGTCDFGVKARNAQEAGYEAVVIFNEGNNEERSGLLNGTLGAPIDIPVVGISYEDGVALAEDGVTARVVTDTEADLERETTNIIADLPRKTRNDDQVVVVGAHLDSVPDGPGINDNGTGVAAVLETAVQMSETRINRRLERPVRYAFWGAEELGLLGAQHYVDTLSDAERSKIYANLNFDMLGSPNYVRLVYDGDGSAFGAAGPAGSAQIETVFTDYFTRLGLPTDPTAFDGRSDYGPFIEYGIPAGGLFSGADDVKTEEQAAIYGGTAGEILDPNYHTPQDDITRINTTILGELSDGVAHATATLGQSKRDLYGDGRGPARAQAKAAQQFADQRGHLTVR